MAHYRKLLKPDPFEGTRRAIEGRLQRIQGHILQKFPSGEPRELMRRTLVQLIEGEMTVEGKIRKLMAVVQQFESGGGQTTDYTDAQGLSDVGGVGRSVRDQRRERGSDVRSSLLNLSQKPRRSFETNAYRFRTQNQQERLSDVSSYCDVPSRNTPFSRLPSSADECSSTPLGKDSAGQLFDSVNEKDIFSFRTQKDGQSPAVLKKSTGGQTYGRKSKGEESNDRQGNSKASKGKVSNRKALSPSSSLGKSKHSVDYSARSSPKSRKLAINRSRKNPNYDGISQIYSPNHAPSLSPSQSPKNPRKGIPSTTCKHLYQKILNRLKFSSCVISKIDHSSHTTNVILLQNRFKLEQETRRTLTRDILSYVQRSEKWR